MPGVRWATTWPGCGERPPARRARSGMDVGKKKDDKEGLAADFFGDDDWDDADDDSDEKEHLPVAPPVVSIEREPEAPKPLAPDAWGDKVTAAPLEAASLSSAPTLHFSAVPTLPPVDAQDTEVPLPPEDMPTATAELPSVVPTEEAPRPVAPEPIGEPPGPTSASPPPPPALTTPTLSPLSAPAPAARPAVAELAPIHKRDDSTELESAPTETETHEVFGDQVGGQEEPLVRTHDPAPPRATRPVSLTDTPPPAPVAVAPPIIERWVPRGDEAAWRDLATTLLAEAALAPAETRGAMLWEAGRVLATRLGDHVGAANVLGDALAAGATGPTLQLDLARALRAAGRTAEAAAAFETAAASLTGGAAADALLDAVELLRDTDRVAARGLARRATEAAPDDYAAWSAVRDLLDADGSVGDRVSVLSRLAALSTGWAAAEAHLEAAGALLGLDRTTDAAQSLWAARRAAPDHGTVFVVLEDALTELGDHAGLAELYRGEATRPGARDAGWWWLLAGRATARAGDAAGAEEAFGHAAAAGVGLAERERQGAALAGGAWAALAASLEREAAGQTGRDRAYTLFLLGHVRDRRLGEPDGALSAWHGALAADPAAGPAADGVGRMLIRAGRFEDLRAMWEGRLAAASETERPTMHLRLAEVCEAAGDDAGADDHFREAAVAPHAGVAFAANEGHARVAHRAARWAGLGEHWARLATGTDDAAEKAELLFRAATVGERSGPDAAVTIARLREVLALDPTHRPALFELCMHLEVQGDWKGVARALDDAGDASASTVRRSVLKYRAARVRLERRVEEDKVQPGLQAAVDADPTFLPALWALRTAASAEPGAQAALYRKQAAAAGDGSVDGTWSSYAAAIVDEAAGSAGLEELLARDPGCSGARAELERRRIAGGDAAGLVALWSAAGDDADQRPWRTLALALALRDLGKIPEATAAIEAMTPTSGPWRAAARLAESMGAWDLAATLLARSGAGEDHLQRARVIGRRKGDATAALPLYAELLGATDAPADVAFGAAIAAAWVGDHALLARAHQMAAGSDAGGSEAGRPSRAASARWAATLHEAAGSWDQALAARQIELALRPGNDVALRGAERALREVADSASLVEGLLGHLAATEPIRLAEAYARAGAHDRRATVLRGALGGAVDLAARLHLEQALGDLGDWQGVYDQLVSRQAVTRDEAQSAAIDARRRWILAEKLAETDAAWDLYRALHDERPGDREVTEALARIAGARGDSALAIQYLKELARSATDEAEAARYQRRVGEVYERNGDGANARQAWLDALDHQNDDREALAGLRRLAERDQDWASLIQVCQREVGISSGARVVELRREIARVTEERLGDKAVAMDAWRAVLELHPDDVEALRHLMALSSAQAEWGSYVDAGRRLADRLHGRERTELLRQIGVACQEQLERDDAVRFYELAIMSDTPDLEAARRLEQVHRARGDWNGTLRAIAVQAAAADSPAERAEALVRAARLELEVRHDRDAAADHYRRVLEVDPDHEQALRFMATHLFQTDRAAAAAVYERLAPMVERGQDLEDFDTRMELSTFYHAYAEMLRGGGRSDEALARYQRALELNPSHLPSLEAAGPLLMDRKAWSKAEAVYRQLLQLTGGQGDKQKIAEVYARLGVVERELGSNDKAYKRFNKALELYPNHVPALKGMAAVLEDRADWSNLLNVFNNIIYHASVPADVIAAYMTKGRILDRHMSRPDKAEQHYQRSLDVEHRQPEALLRMAELAMRRDGYGEAQVFAEKALALPDDLVGARKPLLTLIVAAGLKDAGKADEAKARLQEALAASADLASALGATALDDLEKVRQLVHDRL